VTTNGKQRRVRRNFFALLLGLTMAVYSAVDYFNLYDACLTMYSLEAAIALSCGILYAWWWYSSGSASDVYRWLTLLFFAQVARLTGNIVVRVNYLSIVETLPEPCGFVKDSALWTFRNFPEMLVLLFMLALILGRLWCNNPIHGCLHGD
jgi:hypothetical protein